MTAALLRRLLQAAAVVLALSVVVFLIFFATPGADPAARLAGRGASPETLAAVRHGFALDRPLFVQYGLMMRHLFVDRDLASFVNRGQLVIPTLLAAAPVTLALVGGAAVLWIAGALAIALPSAARPGGVADRVLGGLGLLALSVPVFWLGEVTTLVAQGPLHRTLFAWVPPAGLPPHGLPAWIATLALPCATLAASYAGLYGRVLRTSLIEAWGADHVRTARAKGIPERQVVLRHVLRCSLATAVALFGLDFGALVGGGTVLTEVVFDLHGVGRLTYDAMTQFDLPMILATVTYASVFVVAASAAVDIAYLVLDPRLRKAR